MLTGTTIEGQPLDVCSGELGDVDLARVLIAFRGVAAPQSNGSRRPRAAAHTLAPSYVFDEDSGLIFILD
jgi:hypothetical protein